MSALEALVARGDRRVLEDADLGARTTYRVGGRARLLVTVANPSDLEELGPLLLETGLPIVALGNGSNLLVEDGEHQIAAVRLDGEFTSLAWSDEGADVVVEAGGALDLPVAARRLASEGIVGFEWAVGVPGTFGGAVAMNAGGHGDDVAGSITEAAIWRAGETSRWSKDRLALGYRTSALEAGDLVVSARLALRRGDAASARERVSEIVKWRRENQPGGANGGSVFRNPPGDSAARLLDEVGAKGLRHGSARVSEKHANFIQADDGGSANDVFALIGILRDRVAERTGVTLESEHRFVGFGVTP